MSKVQNIFNELLTFFLIRFDKNFERLQRAYIFEIDPSRWQEEQKKSYLEFLYDRTPLLPQQLQRKGYLDESVTALFYHLTEE